MTQTNETEDKKPKTLGLSGKLQLKKPLGGDAGHTVSSAGRRSVTVEVKRKRTSTPAVSKEAMEIEKAPEPVIQEKPKDSGFESLDKLSREELENRRKALEQAMRDAPLREEKRAAEERQRQAEAIRRQEERLQEQERLAAEQPAAVDVTAEPEEPVVQAPQADKPDTHHHKPTPNRGREDGEEEAMRRKVVAPEVRRTRTHAVDDAPKFSGKITLEQVLSDTDREERVRSLSAQRRARDKERRREQTQDTAKPQVREVILPETITIQELANRMAVRGSEVVKTLMKMGMMVTITQTIDADTAELVVGEFGHRIKRVADSDIEMGLDLPDDANAVLKPRPPVVTVMGHVDHGKTSLLDAFRKTNVVAGEAGGITQHIGAYQVVVPTGKKITFIDTPGHAAFTHMRARGANVTDIVVLVVAADDGIKDQTVEAINHAKSAGVPIIVAINKMDKPGVDPSKVKNELLHYDVVLEDFSGDAQSVEVSAKTGMNIDKLEEAILLQAEVLELMANEDCPAQGTVVEAKMDKGRGCVATVLVQSGTLSVGDIFVAGAEWGRIRALVDSQGRQVKKALPGEPVEIVGLNGAPLAGDRLNVVNDEARARQICEYRIEKNRAAQNVLSAKGTTVEDIFHRIAQGSIKELPVLIKSDVQGSLEAIRGSLEKLSTDEVRVNVISGGVGGINEADINLAIATKAMVIGFNVRANAQARELARREKIDLQYYSIIYNIIDDFKGLLGGLLAPTLREKYMGQAEIRQVFDVPKVGKIAGCYVQDGTVKRGAKVRLLRDNVVIHEGELKTLRRFKDEVKEVKHGYECGMAFENYSDIREGDAIECFEMESIARSL